MHRQRRSLPPTAKGLALLVQLAGPREPVSPGSRSQRARKDGAVRRCSRIRLTPIPGILLRRVVPQQRTCLVLLAIGLSKVGRVQRHRERLVSGLSKVGTVRRYGGADVQLYRQSMVRGNHRKGGTVAKYREGLWPRRPGHQLTAKLMMGEVRRVERGDQGRRALRG